MKYVALLRGINVGGSRKVPMKRLKSFCEKLGLENVFTYINSGNVIFESAKKRTEIERMIKGSLSKEFGFEISILIKTQSEMRKISKAIPSDWANDEKQRTDVAYLFPEIDSKSIIARLPIRKEYIRIIYNKGALIWNVDRKNYNRSHLGKLVGDKLYQMMTVRNVNTARVLAKY